MIPAGVILIWTGTHAGIPANYTRVTDLDDKYTKAAIAAAEADATGGAAQHQHTSPAHTHNLPTHTHTYTLSSIEGVTWDNANTPAGGTITGAHSHGTSTSGGSSGGQVSDQASYGLIDNDPPYKTVIFIESDGGAQAPDDAVCFWSNVNLPTGWVLCDGGTSSPDLRQKYLKGAAAAADAGGSGGSTSNVHDLSHSHTSTEHSHSPASSVAPTITGFSRANGGSEYNSASTVHTHSVSLAVGTQTLAAFATTITNDEVVEPAYKKLAAIQNQSGSGSEPTGIIGLWLGLIADIPAGWVLCDGNNGTPDMRGKYLKVANALTLYHATNNPTGEILAEGGSNTHQHASKPHTHTAGGNHTHTAGTPVNPLDVNPNGSSSEHYVKNQEQTHTVGSISNTNQAYEAGNTTAESSSNEPAYRTVLFIQKSQVLDDDERDAKIIGKDTDSSQRSAKIIGTFYDKIQRI